MNANGLYSGVEGHVIPGTNSGVGGGVANGVYPNEGKQLNKYLLDLSPFAEVAFSLRKLREAYRGPAVRVRRSSDNAEQDIGFDAFGNLEVNALIGFVGSGSGFVSVWYDQSLNSRNMTQTTTTQQPRIVNAGVIERENSLPTISFVDSTDQMTHPYPQSISADIYYVFKSTNSTYGFHSDVSSVSVYGYFVQSGSAGTNLTASYGSPNLFINGQQFTGTTRNDLFVAYGGAFRISSVINAALTTAMTTIRVSGYTAIAATLLGPVSEYVIYGRTQTNRPAIEQNINQYYKIY